MTAGCAGTTAGVNRSTADGFSSQPGGAHQNAGLLIERAGEIEDRGAGAKRLLPVPAGQALRAAEEGEVGAVEGFGADGLDEGDLVAHLLQLALGFFLVEQGEVGGGKRRLGENVLQLPAQQARCSGDCDLVHRHP